MNVALLAAKLTFLFDRYYAWPMEFPGVSCIVPVFNEAERIGGVLAALVNHPLIAEIIVVDDGSTDSTVAVVQKYPSIRLILLPQNGGKTKALETGIKASKNPVLLLMDGDLLGLKPQHVSDLIMPVLEGRVDLAISLRENAPLPWRWIGLDYISGERVFHRSLLQLPLGQLPRFGFEVYLNSLCIKRKCRIAVVAWRGVRSPLKSRKYGFLKGIKADLRMLRDLAQTQPMLGLIAQVRHMRRLRIK